MATTQQVIDALWRACRGVQVYRDLPDGLSLDPPMGPWWVVSA